MTEKERRSPRQARAEGTVEAILDAAFQLLEADGVDKLTTNHIAARAGVSIGTLYQYFASKQDILAALADRRASAVRDQIAETVINQPERGAARQIIRALMQGFEGAPATREALLTAYYRGGADARMAQQHEAFLEAIAGKARLQIELTAESAFVLTHAPVALLRAALAEQELGLDPARLEDELVRLMEAYIGALPSAR